MEKKHPCNVCRRQWSCHICALQSDKYANQCKNRECSYEHEGVCSLGVYSRCGAWKGERSS